MLTIEQKEAAWAYGKTCHTDCIQEKIAKMKDEDAIYQIIAMQSATEKNRRILFTKPVRMLAVRLGRLFDNKDFHNEAKRETTRPFRQCEDSTLT